MGRAARHGSPPVPFFAESHKRPCDALCSRLDRSRRRKCSRSLQGERAFHVGASSPALSCMYLTVSSVLYRIALMILPPSPKIGSMVGPLVNTVPVRVRRNGGETVGDLARRRVEEVLEGGRFAYFFDPYLGDPDAMCVRLAIETYEVLDGVRSTFMDRRIIDDMRMTDRVGGDLVIFIVPGDGVSVSIQANPVRISAERQKELLDQLVDILCC